MSTLNNTYYTTTFTTDDLRNYSVEENFYKLEQLISNNVDLYSDRYLLTTGQQLLKVIAAGASITGFKTLLANRETYSASMQRMDSMLGYAETSGYSASRGSNEVIYLTVNPNISTVKSTRDTVGSVNGYDLIAQDTYSLASGVPITIKVKIGNRLTATRQIAGSNYRYIRFLETNISDDIKVYKNGAPTLYATEFKYLQEYPCIVISNPYNSIDIWFLNTDSSPVNPSDTWTIDYIEYVNTNYTLPDIKFDYGTVLKGSQFLASNPPESLEDLRINIPIYRNLQRQILANNDPVTYFKSLLSGVNDVNRTSLNTVHSLLTYYYIDKHLLTKNAIQNLEEQITPAYYFGYCPSTIIHPTLNLANLLITITLQDTSYQNLLYTQVASVVNNYNLLNTNLDLKALEYDINSIKDSKDYRYIKTARVSYSTISTTNTTYATIGTIYFDTNTNSIKRILDLKYKSGTEISTINTTIVTSTTTIENTYLTSGELLLEESRLIYGAPAFVSTTYYSNDTIVSLNDTTHYIVHPLYTLPIEPIWNSTLGDLTYDKNFIWLTCKYSLGDLPYTQGLPVKKGDTFKISDANLSVQLIGYQELITSLTTTNTTFTTLTTDTTSLACNWNSYNNLSYSIVLEE